MNIKSSDIPTTSGIYKFVNVVNNKIYIGSAKNLRKRFIQHLSNLRLNKHHSKHFQNAWNKYSIDNFEYEIIEFVENISMLLVREQYYLNTLLYADEYIKKISNKFLELGYNSNPFANNRLGSIQSKESIEKSIKNNNKIYPVLQFDFNGNFINEYISTGEASSVNNISRNSIYQCCNHKIEYTHGYFFIFKHDLDIYKEYFESLKKSPFIPTIWNKGKHIEPTTSKKVQLYDRYGRFINTFNSQIELSKYINCTPANVCKAKNKKLIKNYYIFDLDFDSNEILNNIQIEYSHIWNLEQTYGKILMFDCFENLITGFDSVKECSELTNIKTNSIYDVLLKRRKQCKGFIFKYNDDIV